MTMPEMARLLLISRKEEYNILLTGRDKDQFDFVYIADRRRVTKESFEHWYAGQNRYRKLCDRSPQEIAAIERKQQEAVTPRLKVDETKAVFNLQEAAVLLDFTYNEIRRLIQTGELDARKYGTKYMVSIDKLLEMKQNMPEMGLAPKIKLLDHFINTEMEAVKKVADEMESVNQNWTLLDDFFRRMIIGK